MQWIAWHSLIGFDQFFIYLDDWPKKMRASHSPWMNSAKSRVATELSRAAGVHLFSMVEQNVTTILVPVAAILP